MKAIVTVYNIYLDFLKIKAGKVTFTKNDYLAEKSVDLESESGVLHKISYFLKEKKFSTPNYYLGIYFLIENV